MKKEFNTSEISVQNITDLPLYKRIEAAGRVCYRSEHRVREGSAKAFVTMIKNSKHYSVMDHGRVIIKTNANGVFKMVTHCPQQLKSHLVIAEVVEPEDEYDYIAGASLSIWLQLFQATDRIGLQNKFIKEFPEAFGDVDPCKFDQGIPLEFITTDEINYKLKALDTLHLFTESFIITSDRATMAQLRTYRNAAHSVESQRYCNYDKKGFTYIQPPETKDNENLYNLWVEAKNDEVARYDEFISLGCKPEFARCVLGQDILSTHAITASIWEWKHIFDARLNNKTQANCRDTVQLVKDDLLKKYKGTFIEKYLKGE